MLVAAIAATSPPAAPAPRVPDAAGHGPPAGVHVEVLAAGHAWRLVVGPLTLPRGDLLAGLGEQHGPAAPGAGVNSQKVAAGHIILPSVQLRPAGPAGSPHRMAPARPAGRRPRPPPAVRPGPGSRSSPRRCAV